MAIFEDSLTATVGINDAPTRLFKGYPVVAQTVILGDTPTRLFKGYLVVVDGVALRTRLPIDLNLYETLDLLVIDGQAMITRPSINDAVGVSQSLAFNRAVGLGDGMMFGAPVGTQWRGNRSMLESLKIADRFTQGWPVGISQALGLTSTSAMIRAPRPSLADRFGLALQVGHQRRAMASLDATIRLLATLARALPKAMTEAMRVTDATGTRGRLASGVADAVGLSSLLAGGRVLMVMLDGTLALNETAARGMRAGTLLLEGLSLGGVLVLPEAAHLAWVVHLPNTEAAPYGITQYRNWPFTGFARQGARMLACAPDGLYALGGETDAGAPITARLKSGLFTLGTTRTKRLPEVWLGVKNDGGLVLKVIRATQTGLSEHWYALAETSAAPVMRRIKVGKGIKATYWAIELTNATGGDFMLDQIQLYPIALSRRE